MTKWDVIGYTLGDFGGCITFATIGSFLQMFYTDILHISLGKIAILMLVARIWDAINDPLWGTFVDTRKPKKGGRFRPYVFWFSLPLAIVFILCFVKIPGLSENQYLIYAYITYIMYGMLYTAVNIPYGSMASVMTNDLGKRSTLSVMRSLGAGLGSAPGQVLLPLFVYSTVASTGEKYLDQNKLLIGVLLLAGFSLIIFTGFYKMTHEYIPAVQNQPQENIAKTFGHLLKNRAFVTLCLASMLLISGTMYTQSTFNYLFKNYFRSPGLFALVTVCTYLPMLIVMFFAGKLVKKVGKKEMCVAGAGLTVVSYLLLFIIHTKNPFVFLGLAALSGFGLAAFTLEIWAMVTDVIDDEEAKHGTRKEATTYSAFSFFRKLGQTLAGVGSSLALSAIGYVTKGEGNLTQSASVNNGIYSISTIVPAVMYAVMLILLIAYPLSRKKVLDIHDQLHLDDAE